MMEHLPHGELYDYILAKGRLTEAEAARLFGQVVSAIQHLHSVSARDEACALSMPEEEDGKDET